MVWEGEPCGSPYPDSAPSIVFIVTDPPKFTERVELRPHSDPPAKGGRLDVRYGAAHVSGAGGAPLSRAARLGQGARNPRATLAGASSAEPRQRAAPWRHARRQLQPQRAIAEIEGHGDAPRLARQIRPIQPCRQPPQLQPSAVMLAFHLLQIKLCNLSTVVLENTT